jgi:hypothetical protein
MSDGAKLYVPKNGIFKTSWFGVTESLIPGKFERTPPMRTEEMLVSIFAS